MFGRRKVVPIVCIVDAKLHVRAFLKTDLEELGFIVCESSNIDELAAVVEARQPDIVVMGLSAGELELRDAIKTLATKEFAGLVLPIGPPDSPAIAAIGESGEGLSLAILPPLATPFSNDDLRASLAALLPIQAPSPPVDAAEAMRSGWLELWYQPKIHTHKLKQFPAYLNRWDSQ
jgi:DNA-binding response OmpR family regulator